MPARILKILVQNGATVAKGDNLLSIESMKMESKITARTDGTVEIMVQEGELVQAGTTLLAIN